MTFAERWLHRRIYHSIEIQTTPLLPATPLLLLPIAESQVKSSKNSRVAGSSTSVSKMESAKCASVAAAAVCVICGTEGAPGGGLFRRQIRPFPHTIGTPAAMAWVHEHCFYDRCACLALDADSLSDPAEVVMRGELDEIEREFSL